MGQGFVSRGFFGRRRQPEQAGRIPPGQYLVDDWPGRSGSAGRPPPLLLEERQVDPGLSARRAGAARILGNPWLPSARRSLEGRALQRRLMADAIHWQIGTVAEIQQETPRAKTFTIALPEWMAHRAGMHYDIRLTAPDGYQTQRSYSIASEPERQGIVELTVERIEGGEVSPYLHDVVQKGDQLELRGPIVGYFICDITLGGPLLLVGGGSGVVPLMAMIRHRVAARSSIQTRLLYSVRSPDHVLATTELQMLQDHGEGVEVVYT